MPNCDFYAVEQDFEPVLKFVFDDLECRVFESFSAYDSELVEFTGFDQIWKRGIGSCAGNTASTYLQLWPVNASDNVAISRITLDPVATKGATFRYAVEGWGLIQLHLGGVSESGIIVSHTNHNSEKRAQNWSSVYRIDVWRSR